MNWEPKIITNEFIKKSATIRFDFLEETKEDIEKIVTNFE